MCSSDLLTSACAASCVAMAADAPKTFDVPADGRMTVSVNDRTLEAFSSPGMPTSLSITRAVASTMFGGDAEAKADRAARRFKLVSVSRNPDAKVGPVLVKGFFMDARVQVGPYAGKAPIKWSQTDAYGFADVLAGPYAIPAPVVRYHLHNAGGPEDTSSLPLMPPSAWWVAATYKDIGGKRIKFALAPQFATSVASAAAGAAISAELGGALSGSEERVLISHGVARPTRMMRLNVPLRLGPISLNQLLVRIADHGSAASIPKDADPAETTGDVVVRGKRRPSHASYIVYLGADALQGCSSITYDKPRHLIDLSCAGPR